MAAVSEPAAPRSPGAGVTASDLVVVHEPDGRRAEAIRALRTHIVARHVHEGRRAMAVGAPHGGAGCTFVAANLAVSLAQVGIRTLLIDADLREPSVEAVFAVPPVLRGLVQALQSYEGQCEGLITREVYPNLSVLFAGGAAPNPLELLGGRAFERLLADCLRDFEMTIIDTAPANQGADVLRVSSVASYALVVARETSTFVNDVETLARALRDDGATLIGSVLNEA